MNKTEDLLNKKAALIKMRGNFMLILTALIWGAAFVAQSVGMDYIGPLTFNGVRSVIGGLILLPCIFLLDRLGISAPPKNSAERKLLYLGGICCGVILFLASTLQQIGMTQTSAGKAGFITALYIVLVPVFGIFLKRRPPVTVWIGVGIAVVGMYLLCVNPSADTAIGGGDLMVMLCAVCFAFHILVISYFAPKVDCVRMSCIQFLISGIISCILMFFFETPTLTAIWDCRYPILYAGILSCGAGYTLQMVAQRDTDPTIASLLLSLESVFAVLAGGIILHETLSGIEIIGCILIFGAVILAQLPTKEAKEAKEESGKPKKL